MDWFSKSKFGNVFRNTGKKKVNWQHTMRLCGSSHCWSQGGFCLLLPLKMGPRISFLELPVAFGPAYAVKWRNLSFLLEISPDKCTVYIRLTKVNFLWQ